MSDDLFANNLMQEAERLCNLYMETIDEDQATQYVREFIQLLLPLAPPGSENDPLMLTLHSLVYAKVFEKSFLVSYQYASKKTKAIASLKDVFKDL
jgi:hypothetical protein